MLLRPRALAREPEQDGAQLRGHRPSCARRDTPAARRFGGIAERLKAQHGDDTHMVDVRLVTLHEHLVGDVRPALLVMLAAVALVFFVACANVASMLLVRAVNRAQELSVRLALGAGRGGLARLFVAEALVLCAVMYARSRSRPPV
jgi:hypothetical protein